MVLPDVAAFRHGMSGIITVVARTSTITTLTIMVACLLCWAGAYSRACMLGGTRRLGADPGLRGVDRLEGVSRQTEVCTLG